ncbi:MAG: hypothetical protein AAFY59_00050 [Pseudomonadota bacterium]
MGLWERVRRLFGAREEPLPVGQGWGDDLDDEDDLPVPAEGDPEPIEGLKAYDLVQVMGKDIRAEGSSGWVFGLPPGIQPGQWPLDPNSGYPLKHGFTLLLPEEYRMHGPEIVGLSFFAVAAEHNDGMPLSSPGLFDVIRQPGETPPEDEGLRAFWEHARAPHPRMHRMKDILDCEYAVILLTQEEFDGPLCPVPEIAASPLLDKDMRPEWLEVGSAHGFHKRFERPPSPLEEVQRAVSKTGDEGVPARLDFGVPIFLKLRESDPNAGRKALESWQSGHYESPFTESFDYKPWAEGLPGRDHLGGTMFPIQAVPDFSPYYIEFEESFGDYNFGMGNAQLDILNLKFDWACG